MSLAAVLEAREQRWQTKQQLVRRFRACALSLCLNIPGPDKHPPGAERAFALLQAALREAVKKSDRGRRPAIMHEVSGTGADGLYWLMLSPLPAFTLKRMAVRLECEHPLGRLADIDILTKTGEALSRADLALPPRACFVCGEAASLCRRNRAHPQGALMDFVASLLKKNGLR